MKRNLLLLIMFGFILHDHVVGQDVINLDKVIAIVGDQVILQSDIESQYTEYLRQGNEPKEDLKCVILNELLLQKLLLTQAEIDSIAVSPSEMDNTIDQRIQYFTAQVGGSVENLEKYLLGGKSVLQFKEEIRPQIKEQLLAGKMRSSITENVSVSPSEVKSYFESIPTDSLPLLGSEVEVGQLIRYPVYNKQQKDQAKARLEAIRARVKAGEDFGTLAALYSQDPGSARNNGELGPFSRGTMVGPFEAVAFKLKAGELSPIIETKYGFHLLQSIYRRGDQVNVRHILLRPDFTGEELLEAKTKLDSALMFLREKKMTFAEVAVKYSDDVRTRANGGMFSNPRTGEIKMDLQMLPIAAGEGDQSDDQIVRILDTLKVGSYSEPMAYVSRSENKQGYRVLYFKSEDEPHRASLERDYPKIHEEALQEKHEKVLNDWIEKKRKEKYVKIDPSYDGCKEVKPWIKQSASIIN